MKFLQVYQVYFTAQQLDLLDYTPYLNLNCDKYFENSVMAELISNNMHCEAEYFGVVSYKLREKIGSVMKERWHDMSQIANHSINEFTPESFQYELSKHRPDVMSFQRHIPHDPISLANRYHPRFSEYFSEILKRIGFNYSPVHIENIFYCNFFVAKSQLFERYIKEMLIPAMEIMNEMPELMKNSGYPSPLPTNLAKRWGISWYPYHTFLCERMFSYWVHINNLNCLHY